MKGYTWSEKFALVSIDEDHTRRGEAVSISFEVAYLQCNYGCSEMSLASSMGRSMKEPSGDEVGS